MLPLNITDVSSSLPSTFNSRFAIPTIEERKMQQCLETILLALNKLKEKLKDLCEKLQEAHVDWPRYLSSFALCAAELVEVRKALQSERTSSLGSVCALPVLLSRDEDPNLTRQTEHRLPCFNHEIAPHYLRTKLAPEVEARRHEQSSRSSALGHVTLDTVHKVHLPSRMLDTLQTEINKLRNQLDLETNTSSLSGFGGSGKESLATPISAAQANDTTKKMINFMNGNFSTPSKSSASNK